MIGVVVPAHNEERFLPSCLLSLQRAALHPALDGERVIIVTVLDTCTDASASVASRVATQSFVLQISARSVGAARAAGATFALEAGARWLACTDADSVVATDWLACQLAARSDAVCGTVTVRDWDIHHPDVKRRFMAAYRDVENHRHIHGANLGVGAQAYLRAGGFGSMRSSEDVALVSALQRVGASVAWTARPRVATSARTDARAPDGFGRDIRRHARSVALGRAAGTTGDSV